MTVAVAASAGTRNRIVSAVIALSIVTVVLTRISAEASDHPPR